VLLDDVGTILTILTRLAVSIDTDGTLIDCPQGDLAALGLWLLVAHNANGTLKTDITSAADWVNVSPSNPVYSDADTFVVDGDYSDVYVVGMPMKILDAGSYVYASVSGVSFGSGETTVDLDDTVLTGGAITEVLHSAIRPYTETDSPITQASVGVTAGITSHVTALHGNAWTIKTEAYNAASGDRIMADTDTTGAFTVTLPATPSAGAWVEISDYAGTFYTANLTLGRNSSNIHGAASDLVLDLDNFSGRIEYVDATQGWRFV
jgi:hypothetical protein